MEAEGAADAASSSVLPAASLAPPVADAAAAEKPGAGAMDLSQALEMEIAPTTYNKADYIQTQSGNKVSKQSVLCGSQNISLAGKSVVKPHVILRGDLQLLRIGKYVIIGDGSVLRPSYKKYRGNFAFFPMTVGDYVTIGARTIISAAQVGTCVDIGEDCVISKRCIIKENSVILSGTVLPPDTVVPPLTVFGGSPARCLGDLPESTHVLQKQHATMSYKRFIPVSKSSASGSASRGERAADKSKTRAAAGAAGTGAARTGASPRTKSTTRKKEEAAT